MMEAWKKLSGLPSKSTLDSADNFLVESKGDMNKFSRNLFENYLKSSLQLFKSSSLNVDTGENHWIRIAEVGNVFYGIIAISHAHSTGFPSPLICSIGARNNSGDTVDVKDLSPELNNASAGWRKSFTKIRFVNDNDRVYLEVLFNATKRTSTFYVSLSTSFNVTLLAASLSSATNILREIDLSDLSTNSVSMQTTDK